MKTRMERFEGGLLILIMVAVGLVAGAAAFTHVHDWTMTNSPTATLGWFGWANAVITELLPIGSLLEVKRRRRAGKGIGFPVAVLSAFALVSLTAQVSEAEQTLTGWLVAALPALAFMALVKMVLIGKAPAPVQGAQLSVQEAVQAAAMVGRPVVPATVPVPVQADVQPPVQPVRPPVQEPVQEWSPYRSPYGPRRSLYGRPFRSPYRLSRSPYGSPYSRPYSPRSPARRGRTRSRADGVRTGTARATRRSRAGA